MLSSAVKKFLIYILLYTACIGLAAIILFSTVIREYYLHVFPLMLLFFIVVNTGFFALLHSAASGRPAIFARFFLLGTGIRFFIYIIFMFAYIFVRRNEAISFLFQFIILYFAYTAFELVFLSRQEKNGRQGIDI